MVSLTRLILAGAALLAAPVSAALLPGGGCLAPANPQELPRGGWSATASSEETATNPRLAAAAIDGDEGTFWHTKYSSGADKHPHTLTIDLGGSFDLTELRYLPRQGWNNWWKRNGAIGKFEVLVRIRAGHHFGHHDVLCACASVRNELAGVHYGSHEERSML